jgi:hypothetical protein
MPGGRKRSQKWKKNRRRRYKDAFPGNEIPKCPYCGQNVRDVLTAIALEEGEQPTHFDCVIKKLSDEEELQPKEKIIYLGNGSFGVVRFKNPSDLRHFTIRKRIQIEPEKIDVEWRNAVSKRISRR